MAEFISNLDIGAKIGNGHFGDVHVGNDAIHGKVAVKILRQKAGESAAQWDARRAGLLAEASSLKKAKHKHVVEVHQIVETPAKDAIHLVMEFCDNGSLEPRYKPGPMTVQEVRKIATDVSHGLSVLHDRGMLHRDIKPGNILMTGAGDCKLGDFGLVTDNIILGYAGGAGYSDHLAPEVWANGQTSKKTDIWALGMTLYRLLHGDEWYIASPAPRHLVPNGGFVNTLTWLPHISPKWRRLIRAMLNDNSALRPQDAHKMLNLLAGISTEIDWTCQLLPHGITWSRKKGNRIIDVTMTRAGKKFEWSAESKPAGSGIKRRLGGSAKPQTYTKTDKELRAFFISSS